MQVFILPELNHPEEVEAAGPVYPEEVEAAGPVYPEEVEAAELVCRAVEAEAVPALASLAL